MTGVLLALMALVAVWNAVTYPSIGGYDAAEHIEYARALVVRGEFPEGGASYTPPVYYVVAGVAIEVGELLGLDEPERVAQVVNAALAVGTGVLLLALTRLLFPARPVVRWAALAFFVCCPLVLKIAAMFHPQPLVMFLSTLALVLAARMIVLRRYGAWQWVALAVALAATQLVRSVGLWTVGVVVLTLVAAAVAQPDQRRRIRNGLAACAVGVLLLALPWYAHLQATTPQAAFWRGITTGVPISERWPGAFYVSPGLPDVITEPHRGALPPRFLPILYAETWGDYFGIWSWGPPRPEPTAGVNRRLVVQSVVGLPLTVLALAGWLALWGLGLRRPREAPARWLVTLLPLVALTGVLWNAVRSPSPDGDTLKAMFALTAVPAWAISFGFAADVLLARSRRVALPVFAVLALCGLVALTFATYASVS